jgi:uncharacterized protein YodC (DUF2158 family)
MRRRVMVVLAGAALVSGLLATDAQARGGGGHGGGGVGHIGGAHIGARSGGFGGVRVGGIGGRNMAAISRGAVGYATEIGNGTGIGNRPGIHYGTGIHYGAGILGDRFPILAASAFAQNASANDSVGQNATANGSATAGATGADEPAPSPSAAVRNPPVGSPSQETISGPGSIIVGRNDVSTKTVGMAPASSSPAPSSTQKQDAPAFRSGNLVRLRSGGPLMTVKDVKGDQVDCFWTDVNGQINADSFPVDVLRMG